MTVSDGGGSNQDFDLNLAPIIDCFTVLITFMLASASFLAIGVFDSSVTANGPASPDVKPTAIRIDVELTTDKAIRLGVTGKTKLDRTFPAVKGEWDDPPFLAEIDRLRKEYPDTTGLVLNAGDEVQYIAIIRMMEVLKPHIPSVLLGGL